jgi:hypothetical protein
MLELRILIRGRFRKAQRNLSRNFSDCDKGLAPRKTSLPGAICNFQLASNLIGLVEINSRLADYTAGNSIA